MVNPGVEEMEFEVNCESLSSGYTGACRVLDLRLLQKSRDLKLKERSLFDKTLSDLEGWEIRGSGPETIYRCGDADIVGRFGVNQSVTKNFTVPEEHDYLLIRLSFYRIDS